MLVCDVGVGHGARGDQVFGAHVDRFASDRARDRIDGELHRKADAGPGDPSIGREWRLVGRHRIGAATVAAEIVGPRQVAAGLRGFQAGGERPDRVGAGVDQHHRVEAEQAATLIGVGGDLVVVLPRVGAGGQMFAAILDPAERFPPRQREPGEQKLFRLHQGFVAESAADIGRDDAQLLLVDAEAFGEAGPDQMRNLGRRDQHELAGLVVPIGHRALALHAGACLASGRSCIRARF